MKNLPARADLLDWASDTVAFYGVDMRRIGTVLLAQLQFAQEARTFSIFAVTDEIKILEGGELRGSTNGESRFNYAPLIGFHKKHFTTPRFLARNLLDFARSREGRRHYAQVWQQAAAASKDGTVDDAFISRLVHGTTVEAFEQKAASGLPTGEWIVFKKLPDGNYYFTLAAHEEANETIYGRIAHCAEIDHVPIES